MSLSQKINNTFPYIFSYNIGRIFNHIMILIFLFAQYEISSSGDEYLTGIILNINIGRDNIYLILKLLSLGLFLLNLIYTNYLYYYSNECHQNLYHYFKGFDDFDNINDIIQEFANKDEDSDDYEDDEDTDEDDDDEISEEPVKDDSEGQLTRNEDGSITYTP